MPGHIAATAVLSGGRAVLAEVRIAHPPPVARALLGLDAGEAPGRTRRLFALCGAAHQAASEMAVGAARGLVTPADDLAREVLAERISGGSRDFMLAFAPGQMTGEDGVLLRLLHARRADDGDFTQAAAAMLARCSQVAEAMRDSLPPGAPARAPDALTPADDEAVAEALAARPSNFPLSPQLSGRCIETGPYARQGAAPGMSEVAARLDARIDDLKAAVAALAVPEAVTLFNNGRTGAREGWAAVETGRGRLLHWAALDAPGRVSAYGIVAPTDWNFQANGPFARSLTRIAADDPGQAESEARLLAQLFDPCMPCHVSLREASHA